MKLINNSKVGKNKMNECFIIGKIISDIKFDFILNSYNISIVKFEIKLSNKSKLKPIGYNEIADNCYKKLEKGDTISVYGSLNQKMEIIIQEIDRV